MKKLLVAAACALSLVVFADDLGVFDSDTCTLTYDLAADATETKAFTAYGAVTKVVKKGAAMLTVSPDNTDFNGTIDVDEGIFAAGNATDKKKYTVLGKATINIKSGAQFRSLQTCNQSDKYFTGCTLSAEGDGPDGGGAILVNGSGNCDKVIPKTTMTGPMTIGGPARWGFGGILDMNGHTLTNKTASQYMWTAVTVQNAGHIVHCKNQQFTLENGALTGGADHVFTLGYTGAMLNYWSNTQTLNWKLHVKENGYMQSSSGSSGCNKWQGPVEIDAGKTLTLRQNYNGSTDLPMYFTNEISGDGALAVSDNGTGRNINVYLQHANTYTGGTTMSKGVVHATVDQSIPAAGKFTGNGGKALMYLGSSGGWTAAHAHEVYDAATPNSSSEVLSFYTPTGVTFDDNVAFTSSTVRVVHRGPGTLVTSGGIKGLNDLVNQEGTWKISGGHTDYRIKSFNAWNGNLVFENAGYMWMSNFYWLVGTPNTNNQPKVTFKGNTVLAGYKAGNITVGGQSVKVETTMNVGGNYGNTGYRGLVEIEDGAVVSNRFLLGENAGTIGAAFQHGGSVYVACRSEHDGHWGYSGYGHYQITNGKLVMGDCHNIGCRIGGTGILSIDGGDVSTTGSFFLGSGGTGVVHVTGGKFSKTDNNSVRFNQLQWTGDNITGGRGILTMAGNAAEAVFGAVEMSQRTNGAAAFLNLNAGVLQASAIRRCNFWSGAPHMHYGDNPKNQGIGYVNFNGGTFRCGGNGAIFTTTDKKGVNRITVYEKGAFFDTNGKTASIDLPLQKPEGWGVKAIRIPAAFNKTNYLGPQVIAIQGGDANAIEATAITDFNQAAKTISSVEVMSSGCGYKEGDTVRAYLQDSMYKTSVALEVEMEELVGGGIVKLGAGTLTLTVSNSYAGATIVSNGTLKATVAGAIPAASTITVVAGAGTLDVTGVGLAAGQGIKVAAGALTSEKPATRAARHYTLATGLKSAPTVTGELPQPWRTAYRSNGTLTADYGCGLVILLK